MGRFWPNRLLFWNVLLTSFFFPFAWVGFLHLTPTVNVHTINIIVLSWKVFFICKKTKKKISVLDGKQNISGVFGKKCFWKALSSFCLSFSSQLVVFPLSAPLPIFSCTKMRWNLLRFSPFRASLSSLLPALTDSLEPTVSEFVFFLVRGRSVFGASLSAAGLREASSGNPSTRLRLCQSPSLVVAPLHILGFIWNLKYLTGGKSFCLSSWQWASTLLTKWTFLEMWL